MWTGNAVVCMCDCMPGTCFKRVLRHVGGFRPEEEFVYSTIILKQCDRYIIPDVSHGLHSGFWLGSKLL